MAGVKGRSGGANRKSADQHKQEGSYQSSRHRTQSPSEATRGRVRDLDASYRFVKRTLARLQTRLEQALAENVPCERLQREVRHMTGLLLQLGAFLNNQDRLLPQEDETAVDPFDQFEQRG